SVPWLASLEQPCVSLGNSLPRRRVFQCFEAAIAELRWTSKGPRLSSAEMAGGSLMQLWNTKESYGLVAIALHLLIGTGVLRMFFIGMQADLAGDAGNRELRRELMGYHIAWGATLLLFVIARVVSHYAQVQPEKPPQAGWLN